MKEIKAVYCYCALKPEKYLPVNQLTFFYTFNFMQTRIIVVMPLFVPLAFLLHYQFPFE